ncbi:MAG: S-layer family protein [Proteobacteria bacterium]|nr:S-layer family protein [Pseudomonadota bacterium]
MKSRKNLRSARNRQLTRTQVSMAVLASVIAGGAMAEPLNADASITVHNAAGVQTATVLGHPASQSNQLNIETVGAQAVDGATMISADAANASTVGVESNAVKANAVGNAFVGNIDLSVTDGVGVAAYAWQNNTGRVNSLVQGNELGAQLGSLSGSTASVLDNSISASTVVNSASTTLSGTVPVDHASDSTGSVVFDNTNPDFFVSKGTLVLQTYQKGRDSTGNADTAASTARAEDNTIALTVGTDINGTTSSSPRLDGNAIASSAKSNVATNLIDIQAGGASTFAGSAVLVNDQARSSPTEATAKLTSATTQNARIIAGVSGTDGAVNTLTGSLSAAGNSITSTATGNEAVGAAPGTVGNRIALANGVSFVDEGAPASPSGQVAYGAGSALAYGADASLVITNSQVNFSPLSSTTQSAGVAAAVQSVNGGSVAVDDNTVRAKAVGSAASSEIAVGGAASFTGSAAIVNNQQNLNSSGNTAAAVTATSADVRTIAMTGATGGVTHDSTVSVSDNSASTVAYGNDVNQRISLDANTLGLVGSPVANLTGGSKGTTGNLNVSAEGALTISSLQINQGAPVSASASSIVTGIDADSRGTNPLVPGYNTIAGSTLGASGNTQEAVAVGNNGTNGLALEGAALGVGGSTGIASVQYQRGNATASLSDALTGIAAGTHVAGADLTVSDNLQRAVAYGNLGSNTIGVDVNTVQLAAQSAVASQVTYDSTAAGGAVFDNGVATQPAVVAVHGVLNDQKVGTNTGISGSASGVSVGASVEGNLSGSTVSTAGNAVVGAAYGNDATNAVTTAVGNLGTGSGEGFAPVANVTSTQTTGTGVGVSASVGGGDVVSTTIERNVVGSTVSASNNDVEALAYGSRAANTVKASGNEMAAVPLALDGHGTASATSNGTTTTLVTDAAFSLQNAQSGLGSVTASLVDNPADPASSARVLVQVGREASVGVPSTPQATLIDNATVGAQGNLLQAKAVSNGATNVLSLDANSLAATGALQNMQVTAANVSSVIGVTGTAPTDGGPFGYQITGTGLAHSGTMFTAGTLYVDTSSLSSDAIAYLQAQGWGVSGPHQLSRNAAGYAATIPQYADLSEGGSISLSGNVPPSTGTPNGGGVVLAVRGGESITVRDSRLSVSGNTTAGSVTGNAATNTASASANGLSSTSGSDAASASTAGGALTARADLALSNVQAVNTSSLNSAVYGTFAIDATPGAAVSGSTLTVDGNAQSARSVANTATNTVATAANQTAASSALLSVQGSAGAVSTSSGLEMFAPAAVSQSTVSLSNNSNVALGVANDATNKVSVAGGASVASLDEGLASASSSVVGTSAVADHVLVNQQSSIGTGVSSNATTRIYNNDSVLAGSTGVAGSTLTISGNSTVAEASANRASNTLSIDGPASLGATAALNNVQTNTSAVNASASTDVGIALNGGAGLPYYAALNGGTVAVQGNSTAALARGNAATNVLNATPGANYASTWNDATVSMTYGGSPASGASSASAQAAAVVLNSQTNTAAVTASSTGSSYTVALNSGVTPATGVSNGVIGVSANSVSAQAYGNSATNALTLSGLNTGVASGAIGNSQTNTGAVTALATANSIGTTVNGGVNAATLRASGNQVTASAVGNSAVSTIAAK